MSENIIKCAECGAVLNEDTKKEFDGLVLCEDCLNNMTTTCDNCGRRIWNDDRYVNEDTTLCERCFDQNYTTCEDCGRLLYRDDAYYDEDDYPYCHDCYNKFNAHPIKSYNYKPEPIFYGSGPLFMGVELEIDKGGERSDNAESILHEANKEDYTLYAKHDGSIEYGFELVSHPMSLEYHLNMMNWRGVFAEALDLGYRSHQTSTCGLHIHVNRSAFGNTYEEQEDAIGRVVYFVESHWNELLRFSRRTEANINRWASRYGISTTAKDTYKNAKDKHMGRYVAVNLENCNTIEFRIFRGTLNYKTFVATLQLIDEICHHAINSTDKMLESMSWSEFVSAKLGEKLLIPINMRDGSLICVGKGNPDWNYSAPHGAGRIMSRSAAFERLTMEEYEREMAGIYTTCVNTSTLDESPMAYKNMDEIVANIEPTAEIIAHIKPIYNFKAAE